MADTPIRIKLQDYHGRTAPAFLIALTEPTGDVIVNGTGDTLTQLSAGSPLFGAVVTESLVGDFDYVILVNGNPAYHGNISLSDTTEIQHSDQEPSTDEIRNRSIIPNIAQ